jgi:hypothetical protein
LIIRQFLKTLLPLTLVLSACASANLATPDTSSSTQFVDTPSTAIVISTTTTPEITPASENCAYVWASQELPDLSQKVYQSLQTLDANITGNAYAYGENCVYADGHSTFGAMETDFRVKVSVTDLKDENALGDWIVRVMGVITKLPPNELSGPQPGRVEFDFHKSDTENLFLNVSIAKYQKQPSGLSGTELFRIFNNNP